MEFDNTEDGERIRLIHGATGSLIEMDEEKAELDAIVAGFDEEREMQEETGFAARELVQLASVALTPAYSNYRTFIFLARDLYADSRPGDEPEALQTRTWPLRDLACLRSRDDFSDARSLLATYLVQDEIGENA